MVVAPAGVLAACQAAPPPVPTPAASPPATPRARAPATVTPTASASRVVSATTTDGKEFARLVLEAEDFRPEGAAGSGWRPIPVGGGNYMVDSIGASHASGGMLLHAPAEAVGARASLEREIPREGRYKLWARYEYPFRDYQVRVALVIEQPGRAPVRLELGAPDAPRAWFFNLPDAPWHDLPHGVEGLVAEAATAELAAGPARFVLEALGGPGPAANRNLDVLLLTTDLDDAFRTRNSKAAFPLLDEIGAAATGRTYLRITNPGDSGESFYVEASYGVNRVPWTFPGITIDRGGVERSASRARRLEPGDRTPWIDVSCRDTTHPAHLRLVQVSNSRTKRATLDVEIAAAPRDDAVLRRIAYREDNHNRLLLNLPPYPARAPDQILTAEETLERIIAALETDPAPVGRPPARTLVYAGLGDDAERNLTGRARIYQLYRRLFMLLGPSAFSRLGVGALPAELQALREEGRPTPPFLTLGDYRWYPSDENIAKAKRDVDAAGARPYLRGFSYGDEVTLRHFVPKQDKEERDRDFRADLRARGLQPEDLLSAEAAAEVAGQPDDERWARVRFRDEPEGARAAPRLYVESRRYLARVALDDLAEQAAKLRAEFGPGVLYGANFSPHPAFWPSQALFVEAFRRGAINRGSHSDYWWQASEVSPQMTGYLIDVLRAGLGDRPGVIQPYVMPHSPGNTDRDFRRGVYTALAHGAKALDFFQVTPEQANTENYVRHDDLDRYRTIRDVTHHIGAVDDLIADGRLRPTSVAIILSRSTDDWELATPGVAGGLRPRDPADFPSIAYNAERKLIWTALRHAQVPVDFVTEDDLVSGAAARYRVLYLVGDHLCLDAARALAGWVEAGGTLASTAGGGFLDEYDRPSDVLLPVFGLRGQQLDKETTYIRPRIELPRLRILDMIILAAAEHDSGPDGSTATAESAPSGATTGRPGSVPTWWPRGTPTIPTLAFRQPLDPAPDATVLGRFADGTPAAVSHRHGQGEATLWGTLLGAAYVRSGLPPTPPVPDRGPFIHTPLDGFDPDLRRLLVGPTLALPRAGVECSEPLVEAGLLETDGALLVPLACLLDGPRTVDVAIHAAGPVRAVRAVRAGQLPFRQDGDTVRTSLTLDPTDFLVVER